MTLSRRLVLRGALCAAIAPPAAYAADSPPAPDAGLIVEPCRYTLYRGRRDMLTDLFEQAFIAPQAGHGGQVFKTFTDLDDPGRFVWLRSVERIDACGQTLPTSDQHHVLHALTGDADRLLRLNLASGSLAGRVNAAAYTIDIHPLAIDEIGPFAAFNRQVLQPWAQAGGQKLVATLTTETAAHSGAPLGTGPQAVLINIGGYASTTALMASDARRAADDGWRRAAPENLLPALARKPERLRLAPIDGSSSA